MNDGGITFHPEYHRPRFYRYRVADVGFRIVRNRYANSRSAAWIGQAVVIGRYAYCVKWANTGCRITRQEPTP
ncbi:MAG: hypothetical protein HOQ43_06795 [Glycomyces artemisiae]|uniref:Uncharacterized protein n=1 Tax=Glycomyces artemisiae TaxID=1076443 RepID=A0A850C1D7_9ACTN|nr:hypothetical protein [Glycomyces artemisiae]